MSEYVIVIEMTRTGYSADVLDLPGCITTGGTLEETKHNIGEAIDFHLDSMRRDGDPIPPPTIAVAEYDAVA